MSDEMSEEDMRQLVADRAKQLGGIASFAKEVGVSYAFLYNVIAGNKAPGTKVLSFLGYEVVKRRTYRRKQESQA
jgi:hypothetical protein